MLSFGVLKPLRPRNGFVFPWLETKPTPISKYHLEHFSEPGDPYLHAQTYGPPAFDSPALNLRRAVLTQAWNDLRFPDRNRLTPLERVLVKAWFEGHYPDGYPYPAAPGFSFVDICHALRLEPDCARRGIYLNDPPQHESIREIAWLPNIKIQLRPPSKSKKTNAYVADRSTYHRRTNRRRAQKAAR